MKYRHSTQTRKRLMMSGQNRAGQVIEARLAGLAQLALARVPGIVMAVADHVAAVAGRAPHTVRPAMLADQVVALGVIEQRGQADQVVGHETFTSAGDRSPDQPFTTVFITLDTATRPLCTIR